MLHKAVRHLTIVALLVSIGGHWVALQSAAWAGMFVTFALQGPISQAVAKTFDGQHPCALCKAIERGTKSPSKQSPSVADSLKKPDLFSEALPVMWQRGFVRSAAPPQYDEMGSVRLPTPPVPPPREV